VIAGLIYEREEDKGRAHVRRRKFTRISTAWELRAQARLNRLGFIVQPPEKLW
jgi:hypothetical protein